MVITVSRTSRRDLINLFSADPGRLVVIPNGVDPGLGARPSASEVVALKEFYGLQAPLVLVVANDKPHKNLDVVLAGLSPGGSASQDSRDSWSLSVESNRRAGSPTARRVSV